MLRLLRSFSSYRSLRLCPPDSSEQHIYEELVPGERDEDEEPLVAHHFKHPEGNLKSRLFEELMADTGVQPLHIPPSPPYYAVFKGHNAGVYPTWELAQQEVKGFSGAQYRRFISTDEIQQYLDYRQPTSTTLPKYYVIPHGEHRGIYPSWDSCKEFVLGVSGAVCKKFDSLERAQEFLNKADKVHVAPRKEGEKWYAILFKTGGSELLQSWIECQEVMKENDVLAYKAFDTLDQAINFVEYDPTESVTREEQNKRFDAYISENTDERLRTQQSLQETIIYCDGSYFKSDGESKPKAGYGVYFGDSDTRNISSPLHVEELDSYVAEVHATMNTLQHIWSEIEQFTWDYSTVMPKYKIHTDSETVMNLMNNYMRLWTPRDIEKRKCSDELKVLFDLYKKIQIFYTEHTDVFDNHRFVIEWVKGHSDTLGNIEADRLARAGAQSIV